MCISFMAIIIQQNALLNASLDMLYLSIGTLYVRQICSTDTLLWKFQLLRDASNGECITSRGLIENAYTPSIVHCADKYIETLLRSMWVHVHHYINKKERIANLRLIHLQRNCVWSRLVGRIVCYYVVGR